MIPLNYYCIFTVTFYDDDRLDYRSCCFCVRVFCIMAGIGFCSSATTLSYSILPLSLFFRSIVVCFIWILFEKRFVVTQNFFLSHITFFLLSSRMCMYVWGSVAVLDCRRRFRWLCKLIFVFKCNIGCHDPLKRHVPRANQAFGWYKTRAIVASPPSHRLAALVSSPFPLALSLRSVYIGIL